MIGQGFFGAHGGSWNWEGATLGIGCPKYSIAAAIRYACAAMLRLPIAAPEVRADADPRPLVVVRGEQRDERVTGIHQHARGQLFGAVTGLVTVGTRQGQWIVPATHAVWIPPHQDHSVRSHGPFSGWSVYVAEAACTMLPASPRTLRTTELLRAAIDRAASWPKAPFDTSRASIANVILDEIVSLPDDGFGLPAPRDLRLLRVTQRLAAEPGDQRSLDEWAELAAVSPRTLSRRFVEETGFTFSRWRHRARMMRAVELLAARLPVTTVALDLGYDNISAFISTFRRTFGVTPSKFEKEEEGS